MMNNPHDGYYAITVPDYVTTTAARIDGALKEYLTAPVACPEELAAVMYYSVFSGGKRLRPVLAVAACQACGGALDAVLPAACALEMVHAYSLIHDDLPCMDDAATRRGKPAAHKQFTEALAILAGDALLTRAFEIITVGPLVTTKVQLVRELAVASGWCGMVAGQVKDIADDTAYDPAMFDSMIAQKTGQLFVAAARLGGCAADAGEDALAALTSFGKAFGRAFQLVDDCDDAEGAVMLYGLEETRNQACQALEKALKTLDFFSGSADPLRDITNFICRRISSSCLPADRDKRDRENVC